jgi:hypothetical protein
MLGSAVYAIIVDTLLSRTWSRSKKTPCVETHFSHLSLPDEVVNAKEDCYYGNNIKRERKDKSKGKADSNRDCYPHQLNFKKSFGIRIQRLLLVVHPKNVFAGLPLKLFPSPWLKLIVFHSIIVVVKGDMLMFS